MASGRALLLVALLAIVLLTSKVSSDTPAPTAGGDAQQDTDPAIPVAADKPGNAEDAHDTEDQYDNMDHDDSPEDGDDVAFERSFIVLGH